MKRDTIKIGVEADRETDLTLRSWSKDEGRSKRRHAAVVLKNVSRLRKLSPEEITRLPVTDILRRLELVQ